MRTRKNDRRATNATRKRPVASPPVDGAADDPPVVGLVSLGCVKNLVDSEKMLALIAESGAVISGDESLADTMVVNTCGFLGSSRQEALEVIGELAERKRRGQLRRLVVVGCLVQRDGKGLLDAIPEIDALVGVNNREDVRAAVWGGRDAAVAPDAETPHGAKSTGCHWQLAASANLYLGDCQPQSWSDQGRLRLTPRHYAYVRIGEGCDQKCTFCTIPSIRGPMRSKTPEALVAECRELIADGARELVLIGQDTTSYGSNTGYEPGLAGLLRMLDAACDGARWIRLMYAYPSAFTDEMIAAIAECERVVKYIDIPLQHISDRVLKTMGRRVTRRQTETLLDKLRRQIPGLTIRTTFMVGFPGETEAEFTELLEFVRGFGFEALGAFKFSPEPDTPAGRMAEQVADIVKEQRYGRLMLAQQDMAFAAARRRIGTSFNVVVDGRDSAGRVVARHAGQAPEVDAVCLLPDGSFEPGELLPVHCVGSDGYDLLVSPDRRRPPGL